jgi:hypothetical protein
MDPGTWLIVGALVLLGAVLAYPTVAGWFADSDTRVILRARVRTVLGRRP